MFQLLAFVGDDDEDIGEGIDDEVEGEDDNIGIHVDIRA